MRPRRRRRHDRVVHARADRTTKGGRAPAAEGEDARQPSTGDGRPVRIGHPVIVDAVLGLILSVVEGIFSLLPEAPESSGWLDGVSSFTSGLGQVDSLIPILPVFYVAMGILSAVVVFVIVRVILVIINIVWW